MNMEQQIGSGNERACVLEIGAVVWLLLWEVFVGFLLAYSAKYLLVLDSFTATFLSRRWCAAVSFPKEKKKRLRCPLTVLTRVVFKGVLLLGPRPEQQWPFGVNPQPVPRG